MTIELQRPFVHFFEVHLSQLKGFLTTTKHHQTIVLWPWTLRNSQIAAEGILPIVKTRDCYRDGKKGRLVWTDGDDENALSRGIEPLRVRW